MNQKNILIVDDEPTVVELIKRKFQEQGFHVFKGRNGQEGLTIVKENQIDLIVTDVVMPVMDGVDFYKELKKNPATEHIPIIIITDNDVFRRSFQSLGVDHFVAKPLKSDELIRVVENHFDQLDPNHLKHKVIVCGGDFRAITEMGEVLEKADCRVWKCEHAIDFVSNTLIMEPELVLVDILLKELPAREIIASLRKFSQFKELPIITYALLAPEDLGDVDMVEQLKETKDACLQAGATAYIGRYTRTTFLESIRQYL
ncbi:MAG: response regulator, partial [Candidatus Omnitrophica bacterium]|nr:response regulator [Candidatus Omnitrophota bacterium]